MRALLVANTFATTTDDAIQTQVVNELSKHLDITVVNTKARNDAIEIARSAQHQGFELVIGLGGDGTVNEIANGLLLDGPNPMVHCLLPYRAEMEMYLRGTWGCPRIHLKQRRKS